MRSSRPTLLSSLLYQIVGKESIELFARILPRRAIVYNQALYIKDNGLGGADFKPRHRISDLTVLSLFVVVTQD